MLPSRHVYWSLHLTRQGTASEFQDVQTDRRSRTVTPDPPGNGLRVPGRPDGPEVKDRKEDEVTLSIIPPEDDGGSPVICYIVEIKRQSESQWSVVQSDIKVLEMVVDGLQPNISYEFRVTAVNSSGHSQPSPPSTAPQFGNNQHCMMSRDTRCNLACYCSCNERQVT